MNRYTRWLIRLIGPALLAFFLWRSDLGAIGRAIASLNPWPLALSLALFVVFIGIKTWRWQLIMREQGLQPPPYGYLFALYNIGLFAGGVTPGQSGDFVKGWYLRQRGLPLGPSLFSIVLDRLFDFLVMAPLAVLGLVVFVDVFPPETRDAVRAATFGFAALIVVLTPALMARGPREWLFARLTPLLPRRARPAAERIRSQLAGLSLRAGPLALLLFASALSATSTMVRIWLLYASLSLYDVSLLDVVGSTALIAILQTLPISFAGIGVRDVVLVALLARYGHAPELALSLSALFLLLNLEHILVGFLVSLRYPLDREAAAAQPGGEGDMVPQ
ncbi:MAG: lysylphosphatidylglycerol synthase transmembrane domain-containing protein [Chloroflexota bacterium]|nr:MAG: TIGR00374 family protein [Chloroflexota bacterium]